MRFLVLFLLAGCPTTEPVPVDDDDTAGPLDDDDAADDDDSAADDDDATPPLTLDQQLALFLDDEDIPVGALEPVTGVPERVALGEALFFDPILSGNKDTACASCHHTAWGTSDGLSLTVGTGATGVGPERADGDHPPFVPRHSVDLFNRGDAGWSTMFWDGRIEQTDAGLSTPAGLDPLPGLSGVLAAQAMFPVTDPREMRGAPGDLTVLGEANELADLTDVHDIWAALMDRLLAIPAYVTLFEAAYPDVAPADLTFAHAANAIAEWEAEALSFTNTPWDRYLRGDTSALRDVDKLGAMVFFGVAQCGTCHAGPLLSDQRFHGTGIPQIGPGQAGHEPLDPGRELVTGEDADRFAFRTPPLRNVALSAPYMHNGTLLTLEDVVLHYADPEETLAEYDPTALHPDLVDTLVADPAHAASLHAHLSEDLPLGRGSLTIGLSNLREFLTVALTDPAAKDLSALRPAEVPSGLPVP